MAGECGSTCPVEGGWYSYNPSLAGNAVITAAFAFFVPATLFFGVRYQTPLLAATLTTGIALEVVGFVGRILLHGARDDRIFFLLNQLGTVVGPSVVASALFLTLPHVLTIYGIHLSPVKPLNVAFSFYVFVVITVVLQVVGVVFISGEFRNVTVSSLERRGNENTRLMTEKATRRSNSDCGELRCTNRGSALVHRPPDLVNTWYDTRETWTRRNTQESLRLAKVQTLPCRSVTIFQVASRSQVLC